MKKLLTACLVVVFVAGGFTAWSMASHGENKGHASPEKNVEKCEKTHKDSSHEQGQGKVACKGHDKGHRKVACKGHDKGQGKVACKHHDKGHGKGEHEGKGHDHDKSDHESKGHKGHKRHSEHGNKKDSSG